jgi:hypothetical protein
MAAAGHTFPNYTQLLATKSSSVTNLAGSNRLGSLLVHVGGTFNWVAATQAYTTVSQFIANAGSGGGGALTEETGTGYSRQALVSPTLTTSGLVTTLTTATPLSWTTSTISAVYLLIFDFTTGGSIGTGNDATSVLLAYQDFGGTETDTAGTFTFTPNAAGLATWTAS